MRPSRAKYATLWHHPTSGLSPRSVLAGGGLALALLVVATPFVLELSRIQPVAVSTGGPGILEPAPPAAPPAYVPEPDQARPQGTPALASPPAPPPVSALPSAGAGS